MKTMDKVVKSAISGILALTAATTLATSTANADTMPQAGSQPSTPQLVTAPQMEKCYGIVKAGMNDCKTASQGCASSATKDSQPDAFIFLPKGLCSRIVGGNLTMPQE